RSQDLFAVACAFTKRFAIALERSPLGRRDGRLHARRSARRRRGADDHDADQPPGLRPGCHRGRAGGADERGGQQRETQLAQHRTPVAAQRRRLKLARSLMRRASMESRRAVVAWPAMLKVLVADDQPAVRTALEVLFDLAGIPTVLASTPDDA